MEYLKRNRLATENVPLDAEGATEEAIALYAELGAEAIRMTTGENIGSILRMSREEKISAGRRGMTVNRREIEIGLVEESLRTKGIWIPDRRQ